MTPPLLKLFRKFIVFESPYFPQSYMIFVIFLHRGTLRQKETKNALKGIVHQFFFQSFKSHILNCNGVWYS